MRTMRRYRAWIAAVVAISAVSLLLGLVYFQPQKLFLNERYNDPLPAVPATGGVPRGTSPLAVDRVLLNGELRSLEHRSSGSVRLIALADGNRILRFEALATSNGPDLHVYLTTAPASSSWYGYDRDFVDLGSLKGNLGNQNYAVPASVDVARYRTAVIWCKRFAVGFAVAPLAE
jgi:electron transfer DM13